MSIYIPNMNSMVSMMCQGVLYTNDTIDYDEDNDDDEDVNNNDDNARAQLYRLR